jgi:hypothetical protein
MRGGLEQIVEEAPEDVRVRREDPPEDVVVLQVGEGHAPDRPARARGRNAERRPGGARLPDERSGAERAQGDELLVEEGYTGSPC